MDGTTANQVIGGKSKATKNGQCCGGSSGDTFSKNKGVLQTLTEPSAFVEQMENSLRRHGVPGADASGWTKLWILKAQMSEGRPLGQANRTHPGLNLEGLRSNPTDQRWRDTCGERW
jgi:hypothetical protein